MDSTVTCSSFQETHFAEEIRCVISTLNLRDRMCLMCVRIEMTRWLGCRSEEEWFSNPGSGAPFPGPCLNSFSNFFSTTDDKTQTPNRNSFRNSLLAF